MQTLINLCQCLDQFVCMIQDVIVVNLFIDYNLKLIVNFFNPLMHMPLQGFNLCCCSKLTEVLCVAKDLGLEVV